MANEGDTVTYTPSQEGITSIVISRPHARNAVNNLTATKLYEAFLAYEADDTQKVCVFHGANGTFCAGFDLQALASDGAKEPPCGPVNGRYQGPMGPSRLTIAKPVIAAVSGYAVAGGLELSLLADIRVMEEDAIFGVFCRRFGVPLIDGGTVRLQRIVGLGRAMDMILTGRAVGAQEALGMGLANRVVSKGKAVEEALGLARSLLGFPQACMNADRRSAYHAAYEAGCLEQALGFEYENGVKVMQTESVAGAASFKGGKGRHGML